MKKFALAAAVMFAIPSGANAAAFMNGSFESASVDPGAGFLTLGAGSTAITGWTVGGDSIDYIGGYWQPSDGARSIDLSGNGPGSLSQTFDTLAGRQYIVTFDLAGNPDGGPTLKALTVNADGSSSAYSFDTTGATRTAMNWTPQSFSFVATGASTTLTFMSDTGTAYGPALDNVAVAGVPEAASWAMMIGGFGFVGGALRTRRRSVAFA